MVNKDLQKDIPSRINLLTASTQSWSRLVSVCCKHTVLHAYHRVYHIFLIFTLVTVY